MLTPLRRRVPVEKIERGAFADFRRRAHCHATPLEALLRRGGFSLRDAYAMMLLPPLAVYAMMMPILRVCRVLLRLRFMRVVSPPPCCYAAPAAISLAAYAAFMPLCCHAAFCA